ncbi:hypothetical protein EPN42_13395 [bacterium]|nr:MAG: hypothetical protein EPN42_13395 [bacterium]
MIVAAPMSAGGGAGALDVGLFRVTDGQPVFLSDLSVNGGVESVRIDGGRLFVISAAYRGSDRLCCPSGIRTWTYGIIRGAPVLLQSNVTWRSPAVTATVQAAPQRVPATQPPPIAAATRTPLLRSTAPHESPAPPLPSTLPAPAGSDCTPATIYAVAADGSTIDTTDGSVYSVAPAELTISQQWSRGQSVLVCANELINEDRAGQRVGVHSNSTI